MSKLLLDETTLNKLVEAGTGTELCDRTGRTCGFFLTPDQYHRFLYAWAKTQFSDDDSQKALESVTANGGKSTKEVLALLENLSQN